MTAFRILAPALAVVFLAAAPSARADVKLPAIIGDNMVLQAGKPVPIWGTAEPGEKVEVRVSSAVSETTKDASVAVEQMQAKTATADEQGHWMVTLDPLVATSESVGFVVTGNNKITLKNVLVGDVWLCSGQSNMEWSVANSDDAEQEIASAKHPKIRLFQVKNVVSADEKLEDVEGAWVECTPETVRNFSAVGYFFGRAIHKQTGQPVGLIQSDWGGTPAEAWTSREKLESVESLQPLLDRWKSEVEKNQTAASNPHHPATLFNAMIHPLIPYAIKGAIWYQGESNVSRAYQYRTIFPAMITDWRERWGQGEFPFLWVQLANYLERKEQPSDSAWAELREAQNMALSLPNTGQALAIDIGEAGDIHPRNKQDVGKRLALAARHVAYGDKDVVYSGPTLKDATFEDGQAMLTFENIGSGLKAQGGELKGFAIAGEDQKFHWAETAIDGDKVIVKSAEVPKPVAVRYAWADNPAATLYNAEGLPASPFRTDDWPGVTEK